MNMRGIYIFGAHPRARTTKEYLTTIYPDINVRAFLVDNDEENPSEADGVKVVHLKKGEEADANDLDKNAPVYLGIRGVNQPAVCDHLKRLGFTNIIPVTVDLDMKLRNEYLEKCFAADHRRFKKLDAYKPNGKSEKSVAVYVVSSAFDSVLKQSHEPKAFERVIQVGCSLTDKCLEDALYDNEGDNISERNAQFCELTAMYWIWKNAKESIVGLEHYRRFFLVGEDLGDVMSTNDIDVILPTPLCVLPSLKGNYLLRHEPRPFEDMMAVFREKYPDDFDKAVSFFDQKLYSPCNMLIARKEVFDRLCAWMFPILFEVADRNRTFEDRYQNRYPGFLSERLISFFFELHRDEYKVVYADKNFLS